MTTEKKKAAQKLKTAKGQIDGILKMIEEDRYCIDISTQILSVIGLLKKANLDVLDNHLKTCVTTAIIEGGEESEEKIEEIITIIDRYVK